MKDGMDWNGRGETRAMTQTAVDIATRFLQTRLEVRSLRARDAVGGGLPEVDARRLAEAQVEMETLAWVLGVNLERMNAPALASVLALDIPDRVRVLSLSAFDAYLVEFPPTTDPNWTMAYRGEFLSVPQARELESALLAAMIPGPCPDRGLRAVPPAVAVPASGSAGLAVVSAGDDEAGDDLPEGA
jgi:hypothetical protein